MSDEIVLVVTPAGYNTRGQLFQGQIDGRLISCAVTSPMLFAARALLREGVDPKSRLVMRPASQKTASLVSTVGAAAKLTVRDSGGAPRFAKWKPLERRW
jgi:hypothetical protein